MYSQMERKKRDDTPQADSKDRGIRNKQQLGSIPRGPFQNAYTSNVVQRTRWRCNREHVWEEVKEEEGEKKKVTLSPMPTKEETDILLGVREPGDMVGFEVDTASADFLPIAVEAAGWQKLGGANQNTRYQAPTHIKSEPHAFPEEYDIHRFLRWLSTWLKYRYEVESEIQCYYDTSTRRILVAANKNSDIHKLSAKLCRDTRKTMKLHELFKSISVRMETLAKKINVKNNADAKKERVMRHLQHMAVLSQGDNSDRDGDITLFVIPAKDYGCDLHAEQRILHYLRKEAQPKGEETDGAVNKLGQMVTAGAIAIDGKNRIKLRPELLGGIKRPCLACAFACFTREDFECVHPGLLWLTKAATQHLPPDVVVELLERIRDRDHPITTYSTARRKQTTYRAGMARSHSLYQDNGIEGYDSDSEGENS